MIRGMDGTDGSNALCGVLRGVWCVVVRYEDC